MLARTPLPERPGDSGFLDVEVAVPAGAGTSDLCFTTTGDTRPDMWVLDQVRLLPAR